MNTAQTSSICSASWNVRDSKTHVIAGPFFVNTIRSLPIRIEPLHTIHVHQSLWTQSALNHYTPYTYTNLCGDNQISADTHWTTTHHTRTAIFVNTIRSLPIRIEPLHTIHVHQSLWTQSALNHYTPYMYTNLCEHNPHWTTTHHTRTPIFVNTICIEPLHTIHVHQSLWTQSALNH